MTTLEILRTGPLALVEDLGRKGMANLGVTQSGAADRRAHKLANRLVANPGDRATIEVTLGGLSARVHGGDVAIAVTGSASVGSTSAPYSSGRRSTGAAASASGTSITSAASSSVPSSFTIVPRGSMKHERPQ